MTSPVEWKNEQSLEARALYALWRNHPLTAVKDRWGERAHRLARANRDMLLSWAATQPDYRLRDCRNIGAATLAWIRANQRHQPEGVYVTKETLAAALGEVRGIPEWRSMEDIADGLAAAEGADSYSSQDTDEVAQHLRRECAAAIIAALRP